MFFFEMKDEIKCLNGSCVKDMYLGDWDDNPVKDVGRDGVDGIVDRHFKDVRRFHANGDSTGFGFPACPIILASGSGPSLC